MDDLLYDHQGALTIGALREYAQQLVLDADRLVEDVHERRFEPRVSVDVAGASGVSGTPTSFINARRHQGAYDI